MGVLNATPDSFSDGGALVSVGDAIAHGQRLVDQGAAIVDVGGESTRPGAERVSPELELRRVLPVIAGLTECGVHVSIDTMRAATAVAAVKAGARTVNDVSGGLADPDMLDTVASLDVDYVAMHWRAHSRSMQSEARYDDVVHEVLAELRQRRDAALRAGIEASRIILDPGIGFSKLGDHNWTLLENLPRLQELGHRILVGVSRKKFLGELLGGRQVAERDVATAVISGWCATHCIWGVRTHDVLMQVDAIAVGSRFRPR